MQQQFKETIPQPIYQINHSRIQNDKLLTNLKAHYSNTEALVYKVKQINEFIPQMKTYYLNKIPADYQEGRSVFHPMETIRNLPLGIMTERKYDKMKTIKPKKTLELINQDLSQNKRSNIHPQTCQTSSLPSSYLRKLLQTINVVRLQTRTCHFTRHGESDYSEHFPTTSGSDYIQDDQGQNIQTHNE